MKHVLLTLLAGGLFAACAQKPASEPVELGLKDVLGDKFLIGTALNQRQVAGEDTVVLDLVKKHFNSIVAENCMKAENIHPREGSFAFGPPDAFVKFGMENDMFIVGHCLIWHSQAPDWFFVDDKGKQVSAEVLRRRMENHIKTIVWHFRERVNGWDVVNEAFMEDGSYRKSKFYEILGEEYIPLAFQYAYEADPGVELYYNDYNMYEPGKREAVIKLIKQLKERGLRIDAVGMQGHMDMERPTLEEFEESMVAYGNAGVKVMVTEWDMSALPRVNRTANIADTVAFRKALNPYPDALPDSVSQQWNRRMGDFMQLFIKHSDIVSRVTAWGLSDGDSWKNGFPVRGRTDYPLLFDRNHEPKPFVEKLLNNEE